MGACKHRKVLQWTPDTRMMTSSPGKVGRIERWLRLAREGLFGVLYVMSKDTDQPNWFILLMWGVGFMQLLHFPINDRPNFPWATGRHYGVASLTNMLSYSLVKDIFGNTEVRVPRGMPQFWCLPFKKHSNASVTRPICACTDSSADPRPIFESISMIYVAISLANGGWPRLNTLVPRCSPSP